RDRQDAARAAAFVDAFAARDFGAENPRAPLRLRAGVETEDGVVVAGRDVGSDGARRREMVRDVIVRPAHVEADIGARPIVVRHRSGDGASYGNSAAVAGAAITTASARLARKSFFMTAAPTPAVGV